MLKILMPGKTVTNAVLFLLIFVSIIMFYPIQPGHAANSAITQIHSNKAIAKKHPKARMRGITKRYAMISASARPAVKKMIRAGNQITKKPYLWGGGHSWKYSAVQAKISKGYDCSGAVSYLLQKANLLDYPLTSTGFMKYGKPGKGLVTIYSNRKHVFMVVAGLRWDTSYLTDGHKSGPGWSETMRPTKGFRVRHIGIPQK